MADKKILKLIEQALKQGETSLSLSFNKLTSLPPEITKLTNLTSLYLSENKLPIPETEQWGQVLEFKDKFPKDGLWWPYKGMEHIRLEGDVVLFRSNV